MTNILIIDDDKKMCDMISFLVQEINYNADHALTLADGLKKAVSGNYDAVFLDVSLPDGNGIDILDQIRSCSSTPEVIIMTGFGDPDGAEIAIKKGAWDYLSKPLSSQNIILLLNRIVKYRDSLENNYKPPVLLNRKDIIGNSGKLTACLETVAQAANSEANILITGETGTGKELFARAIHNNSQRPDEIFVVVDCAALPETLIESSLFGYEKGAFTGANHSQEGLIKLADGGTLFLDEVGELSMELQKAFLRVLQERKFRPIGGKQELRSNFRLISATNKNIDQLVKKGHFREDLLYRLRTFSIELPPLRERLEDIKALAIHYTMIICSKYKIETKGFSHDFFDSLFSYFWPGNIRELVSTLEETIYMAKHESTLLPQHLPNRIRIEVAKSLVKPPKVPPKTNTLYEDDFDIVDIPKYKIFQETVLADLDKKYFQDLIATTKGNIKKACEISGLSRSGLYAILKKYNISRMGWS